MLKIKEQCYRSLFARLGKCNFPHVKSVIQAKWYFLINFGKSVEDVEHEKNKIVWYKRTVWVEMWVVSVHHLIIARICNYFCMSPMQNFWKTLSKVWHERQEINSVQVNKLFSNCTICITLWTIFKIVKYANCRVRKKWITYFTY